MRSVGHFINGQKVFDSTRTSDVTDPADGATYAKVALGEAAEVNAAVEAARNALPGWSATPPVLRARIMFRFRDLVEQHSQELAELITAEHGKVLPDARGEVLRGLEVAEFACGIPHLQKGEHSEQVGRGVDSWSLRQPLGIVAGITPFNFPVMVPMWMFPIAIACGNTFILKPSEKDPSPSLLLAELLAKAGLPKGVFNVVQGTKPAVDAILAHPEIEAVSFVGSTNVAGHIYRTASRHGKRVQALGGAKNHMVVLPDADLGLAAGALMGAAYGSAGERCMAISVAVAVGDDTADQLIRELKNRIARMKIGPGRDSANDMGPLVTREHLDRVRDYVRIGVDEGAELVVDGRSLAVPGHNSGFFLGPTLFDRVTPSMRIYKEEIFGPVLCVARAPDADAALALVNDHELANGTAIFTRNGGAANRYANRVKVGMVGINVPIPVPMAFHSFGGWKRSLFGDVAVHGVEGVRFYTRLKTVTSRWPDEAAASDFAMPVAN